MNYHISESDSLFSNFSGMRFKKVMQRKIFKRTNQINKCQELLYTWLWGKIYTFFLSRLRCSYKLFNVSLILWGLQHCPAPLHLQNSQHGIDNDLQAQTFSREHLRQLRGVG